MHSLSGIPLAQAPFRVHLDLTTGWTVLDLSRGVRIFAESVRYSLHPANRTTYGAGRAEQA